MKVIQKYFAEKGLDLRPAEKSKYVQSFEILAESTLRTVGSPEDQPAL